MEKADILIMSKNVFTGCNDCPQELAIAIKGSKILEVLPLDKYMAAVDNNTVIYNMGDALVTSGFCDSHVHLLLGCLMENEADLSSAKSQEEAASILFDFYTCNKHKYNDGDWVLGFMWYNFLWDNKDFPVKESLDVYFKDIPVFLLNSDGHGAWVNSKALEICGVTSETKDPKYGKIFRDEKGEPTGYLDEEAMNICAKEAFNLSREKEEYLYKNYLKTYSKMGITSVNDMQLMFGFNMGSKYVFEKLNEEGNLPLRINFALGLLGDIDEIKNAHSKYRKGKIYSNGTKEFADGLIITHTANMVKSYSDDANADINVCAADFNELEKRIIEVQGMGINIQIHSTGDGAVRFCLNAYKKAIEKNGYTDSRLSVEHIDLISPEDAYMFGKYKIIASIQPQHLALTESLKDNPYPKCVGDREKYLWAYGLLKNNGATLALGTDYPTAGLNPMMTIYRGVTRLFDDMEPKGGWNTDERLSIKDAIIGYTLGGAIKVGREKELGTIEKGKLADIAVFNKNLFNINESEIKDTKCILTICDGEVVYKAVE